MPDTRRRHGRWIPLGFLLPFGVPFVLFYLLPVGYAMWQSTRKVERVGGTFGRQTDVFAGLEQYRAVLADADFLRSVGRVALFGVVQVPVMLAFALALALVLDSTVARLRSVSRVVAFLPYGVPGIIAAIMWAFLYDGRLSPVVAGLDRIGLDPDFLGPGTILWSVANVVTWTYAGYNMLILYSALKAIPQDIYEAARIDGAGDLAIALRIKVPMIMPALVLATVFSIIGTLQLFAEPFVLRAVSTNVTSTFTPNLATYSAASANNYSFAAAMAVTLALATFVLSFGFLKLTQRRAQP